MFIEFRSIKFKNVLSYGAKWTEINLKSGLTLISGRNGNGKTTLLDALSYCLFGKPYRKITLQELINRTNKRNLDTEVVLFAGSDEYKICRGMKPDRLVISKNGSELDNLSKSTLTQEEVEKIIGIDYKMFRQVISLAISYNKPFISMDPKEKREMIESIFNVKVFGSMLKDVKKLKSEEKVKRDLNQNSYDMTNTTLNVLTEQISSGERAIGEFESQKASDISRIEQDNSSIIKTVSDIKAGLESTEKEVENYKLDLPVQEAEIGKLQLAESGVLAKIKETEFNFDKIILDLNKEVEDINKLADALVAEDASVVLGEQVLDDKILVAEKRVSGISEEILKSNILMSEKQASIKGKSSEAKNHEEDIDFLSNNAKCQKCKNEITAEYRETEIHKIRESIGSILLDIKTSENDINVAKKGIDDFNYTSDAIKAEIENIRQEKIKIRNEHQTTVAASRQSIKQSLDKANSGISKVNTDKINSLRELNKQLGDINKSSLHTNYLVANYKDKILNIEIHKLDKQKEIDSLKKRYEGNLTNISTISDRKLDLNLTSVRSSLESNKIDWTSFHNSLLENDKALDLYDIASKLLGDDGIKTHFIKQLVPILNYKINEYMMKFDLPIRLNFDESMNERISRTDNSDQSDLSYHSHSEGEKKSIDIAILFSFIGMAKVVCNWNCNLMIVDELLDGQVDAQRLEKMIECLKNINSGVCTYVISHRASTEFKSYFDDFINIEKIDGFSEMNTSNTGDI